MLITDKYHVGDRQLSPEEGVAKGREENLKLAAQHKIPDQELLEDRDMAEGTPMHPHELIRRIQRLNPELIVEQGGIPNAVVIRRYEVDEDGELGKKYLTGFYVDRALPEFSSLLLDKNGLPKREFRGWRTVLLNLMRVKALTYRQVKKAFGEPHGQRNSLWMKQTRGMR